MFEELALVRMASAMARNAGARHKVIAQNVANADTPNYRAMDVKGFSEYVNRASFDAYATRPGHMNASPIEDARVPQAFRDLSTIAAPNGNSVSLGNEMIKAVESQGQHALATSIYSKVHDILRLGLGRGR